ncbi:MAG: hypothetical protein MUD11_16975 [Rhodobacteraceae bacterium]|jgi:hypothetical protein|nr:hypothetical protein [Paracoccaceae bacterium]
MTLKIEAGRFYRTRDGRKVGPMNVPPKAKYWSEIVFADTKNDDGGFYGWLVSGAYFENRESREDLIAEWTDEPAPVREVGTLAEIGARVGDVVECLDNTEVRNSYSKGGYYVVGADDDLGFPVEPDGDFGAFRIIRRAPDAAPVSILGAHDGKLPDDLYDIIADNPAPAGPVITETVRRIVPGVYGRVMVHSHDCGAVSLDFCGQFGVSSAEVLTATELRATIATLTEIADALEGGAK